MWKCEHSPNITKVAKSTIDVKGMNLNATFLHSNIISILLIPDSKNNDYYYNCFAGIYGND